MKSNPVEQGRRVRMTVVVLIRLALAVLVILMCSWAMAIAWAAGTQADEAELVKGPAFIHEVSTERMLNVELRTGVAR